MKIKLVEIMDALNNNGVCYLFTYKNTGIGGLVSIIFFIDKETYILKVRSLKVRSQSLNSFAGYKESVINLQYPLEIGLNEIIPNAIKDLNIALKEHDIALIELDSEDHCNSDIHFGTEEDYLPNPDGSRTT